MEFLNKIIQGNCLQCLDEMQDESVNCCITSPPYWALRDYGYKPTSWPRITYTPMVGLGEINIDTWNGCLGFEPEIEMFIAHIILIFRQVWRVLKNEGTLWLNFGDSYARNGGNGTNYGYHHQQGYRLRNNSVPVGINPKNLIGIPWRVAFALQADGWYLRQDIIWNKPNPMPESVTDRCTKSHEYIFLLSKNQKYYYDANAIKETASNNTHARQSRVKMGQKSNPDDKRNGIRPPKVQGIPTGMIKNNESFNKALANVVDERNKRSVWTVRPEAFTGAHFATFPQMLIVDCIKAGCPENGIVLDPFMGAGTTALVSRKLNRNFIGFELNEEYITIANTRLYEELGFFI